MATSQQIARYYDVYRDKEVTFTKDISKTLNLDPRQIYVKCGGSQWPCILNSTSFQMARIIIGTKGGAYGQLSGNGNKDAVVNCNIRFCFTQSDNQPLAFFVASRVTSIQPYMNSQDLAVVTLTFTQRPPDDLIEIMGNLLEATANSIRRRDERIVLNEENKRKLGVMKEETLITVQNIPRHCILRDLSFCGAKVILLGLSQFLAGKEALLYIDFEEPRETLIIKGTIAATVPVQGRKDICAASIVFDEKIVPLSYKIHINSFLTTVRKVQTSAVDQIEAQKAAQAEAVKKRREAIAAENAKKEAENAAAQKSAVEKRQAQIQNGAENAENEAAEPAPETAAATPEAQTAPAPETQETLAPEAQTAPETSEEPAATETPASETPAADAAPAN